MLIVLFWSPLKRQVVSCFFFSSRRRHTRLTCDWSSDVLFRSLDGARHRNERRLLERLQPRGQSRGDRGLREIGRASCRKECRSRWSPYHSKKKASLRVDESRTGRRGSHPRLQIEDPARWSKGKPTLPQEEIIEKFFFFKQKTAYEIDM